MGSTICEPQKNIFPTRQSANLILSKAKRIAFETVSLRKHLIVKLRLSKLTPAA